MIININGYEVEIKAKYTNFGAHHNERYNKRDTQSIINQIAIWASESATRYNDVGCYALGRTADKANKALYATLEASGYFKNLEQ